MTEELKHFVEEYFKLYPYSDECDLNITYLVEDEYFTEDLVDETISMLDKDDYVIYIEEGIESDNEELYNSHLQYFKDNYENIIKDIPTDIPADDINSLDDDGEYCGWVVKRDNPTEIVYVSYGHI